MSLIDPSGRNAADFGRTLAASGGGATLVLLADDATIIGFIDDVLIPFTAVACVAGLVIWGGATLLERSTPPATRPDTKPADPIPAKPDVNPVRPDVKPDIKPAPPLAPGPKIDPKGARPNTKPNTKPKTDPKADPKPKPDPKKKPRPARSRHRPGTAAAEVGTYLRHLHVGASRVRPGGTAAVTDMPADLSLPLEPQAEMALALRYILDDDEEDPEGWGPAELDTYDVGDAYNRANRYSDNAYFQMRGREQQLIDHYGGAWTDTGKLYQTGNEIRAVGKENEFGIWFHEAASARWGEYHPYTGW